jgi:hypothetical protein
MIPGIIDELNRRMEEALDNNDDEKKEVLHDFYSWFVEKYVY